MRWGQRVLLVCAGLSAGGILFNVLFPPEKNAYLVEQALILLLALIALAISRRNIDRAVAFFFSAALAAILIAMARFPGDGQIIWAAAPFVFALVVAALTMNRDAIIIYGIVALIADCIIGAIYGDAGLAGALMILTGFTASAFVVLCADPVIVLGKVQKKLDKLRGEASRLNQKLEQQEISHDP